MLICINAYLCNADSAVMRDLCLSFHVHFTTYSLSHLALHWIRHNLGESAVKRSSRPRTPLIHNLKLEFCVVHEKCQSALTISAARRCNPMADTKEKSGLRSVNSERLKVDRWMRLNKILINNSKSSYMPASLWETQITRLSHYRFKYI